MTTDSGTDRRNEVLANGVSIPRIGFGVWQVDDGDGCVAAVRSALEAGYRHIDTAQAYGNEGSVGTAIRDSGIPREEIFITTKFFPRHKDPLVEIDRSLERLSVDFVDLYLVHWPEGGATWAWPQMEAAHHAGKARSIGISNFSIEQVNELLATSEVTPAVNQVQFSAFEYRRALRDLCNEKGIAIEAYSPLGTGRHLGDETVGRIAKAHDASPAQVLIKWCLDRGTIVLPKSTHEERIVQNLAAFDLDLTDDELAVLDALDTTDGTDAARENQWWS